MTNSKPPYRRGLLYRLGKLLFPGTPSDLRRRKVIDLIVAVLVGLVVAGVVLIVILQKNSTGRP